MKAMKILKNDKTKTAAFKAKKGVWIPSAEGQYAPRRAQNAVARVAIERLRRERPRRSEAEIVESFCAELHDAYERAAVRHGWATNPDSRTAWHDLPSANRQTMLDAVGETLAKFGLLDDVSAGVDQTPADSHTRPPR